MPQAQVPFYSLNAGEVDPDALARIDLEKLRVAAESMVNFTPTVLGGMHMRPGTKYLGTTKSNAKGRLLPFVFSSSVTSLIEVTGSVIRIWNSDAPVTYANYSTTLTNGSFTSAIGTGWTNVSTTSASASTSGGNLLLNSTNYSYARARQSVSVSSQDSTVPHCLRIDVTKGNITFRIGTSAGGNQVVRDQLLGTGTHFIAFTPNANTIFIDLEANEKGRGQRIVAACDFVKNSVLEIPSPWGESDLGNIRYAQSGSVLYLACKGKKQYKLERRGPTSWGLADYETTAGPYLNYSGSKVRLRPSATIGQITLTADQPFFRSGMVGSVFEITSTTGQYRSEIFTGPNQATKPVKLAGANQRTFSWSASYGGGASGTVYLEWSYGTPDNWEGVLQGLLMSGVQTSGSGSFSISDSNISNSPPRSNDNVIVYYRLVTRGSATGPITAVIDNPQGTQVGVVRITGYSSPTSVTAEVLDELGSTGWTEDWREGAWGSDQSWPNAVAFYDGRLFWGGLDKVYGSVSDDFTNFDPNTEGDAGPIVRSIATGPVESIGWLLPLQRLMVGTASAEVSIRSSSFDEPLTPSAFTARNASTVGSAAIQAVAVDSAGIFAQKNLSKVYEIVYDVQINDYSSRDLTRLNKNICKPGVIDFALQRQPDTRVWFVKSDGTMAMLVYERADEVVGWARFETDGAVEAVCVLPSENDDIVYLIIRRTIDGQTRRYIERMTVSSETEDGDGSWLVDSAVQFSTGGAPTKIITGLGHLVGKQVIAKGGSDDPEKLYTVASTGQITVDNFVTSIVVGLRYEARFKSVKLAYGSASGTALGQKKRVDHLNIVANNTAPDGVRIGRDFTNMTRLSSLLRGKEMTAGQIVDHYDYDASSFNGMWDSDSRVCIRCVSPYPAHIIGMVVKMNTNDKQYQWPRKRAGDDGAQDQEG
jgi:hypothetical protein